MPKAILAIRRYPITLLFAVLLFLATLVVTTGSLGKVGGDEGDGGSGIGGTGRSGDFGGSGFGGTGSPFVTSVEEDEQGGPELSTLTSAEIETVEGATDASDQVAEIQIAASPAAPFDQFLESVIEETIAQHPLALESEVMLATDGPIAEFAPSESVTSAPELQMVEALPYEISVPVLQNNEDTEIIQEAEIENYAAIAEEFVEVEHLTADDVTQQIAETLPVKMDSPQVVEPEIDRRNFPEKIQRPELPPLQRVRPVDRVSIMPPRVQPMRI